VAATRAEQEAFSKNLSQKFPGYSQNVWGVSSSDSTKGYTDWGASLTDPRIDGTVVPSAAAGSLMFAPDICITALRTMLVEYGRKIYGRYGFADAFNPTTGWVSQYVIGIDVGISLLSAENLRTGKVWQWFMSNVEPERALDMVGLVKQVHEAQGVPAATDNGSSANSHPSGTAGKPESYPEIPLMPDAQIPLSGFKFKIPVPLHLIQQNGANQDGSTGSQSPTNGPP